MSDELCARHGVVSRIEAGAVGSPRGRGRLRFGGNDRTGFLRIADE